MQRQLVTTNYATMGIRLLGAIVLATAVLLPQSAPAQKSVRIAGIVNDDILTVYDVDARMSLLIASSGLRDTAETRRRLIPEVLRALIDEKLKLQEAKRIGVTVSEGQIKSALADVETRNDLGPGGLAAFFRKTGIDKSTLVQQIEAEISWSILLQRRLVKRIRVGENEIDSRLEQYESSKTKSHFQVREIFLPIDGAKGDSEARTLASRLVQQLREGASFAALARNFSKSASAPRGGDIGWVAEGSLGKELDTALKRLSPDQVAGPIQTLTGFYIIRLVGKRIGNQADPGDTTVALSQLFLPLPADADSTRVKAEIDRARRLATKARSCSELETAGKQVGSATSGGLGKVKMRILPQDIQTLVSNLDVGVPSQPHRSAEGVVVLMVCERILPPHPKAPSRKKIKKALMTERLAIQARRYLRDLKRAAVVDIRL